MAFKPTRPQGGKNTEILPKAASLVTTRGGLVQLSVTTGLLEVAGASTVANQILWIANTSIAAADALTSVEGTLVLKTNDEFLCDTVNNSDAAHNGQRMVLSAGGLTLNNTGTDSATGVFQQIAVVGAAANKQVRARKV